MKISITSLSGNDRGPRHMESVLRAIHAVCGSREAITIGYEGSKDAVGLFVEFPDSLRASVLEHLQDAFPACRIEPAERHSEPNQGDCHVFLFRLHGDFLPLRAYGEFESTFERDIPDPATGLLAAVRSVGETDRRIALETRLRPAKSSRLREADEAIQTARRGFPTATFRTLYIRWRTGQSWLRRQLARWIGKLSRETASAASVDDKTSQTLYEAWLSVRVIGGNAEDALSQSRRILGALNTFATADTSFAMSSHRKSPQRKRGVLLSAAEVAHLFHPIRSSVQAAKVSVAGFRELEPPASLPAKDDDPNVTAIGRVRFRGQRRRFGIRADDLRRHVVLCGRTGTGKTTLIRSMALDAIHAGRNVFVIDPHGDLAESILDNVPRHRTNDVCYFNAADREHPVAFNPLHCHRDDDRPLVADGLVSSLKKLYGDSWGPRLEQLLRNSVLALLEHPDTTLLSIRRLLTSKNYRSGIVAEVSDPVVRSFWTDTFAHWTERFQAEAVSPVTNKLDAFLANAIARNITCQPRSMIDIRSILDNPRSIFVCNLSKGLVGEQTSTLLGAFLVAALQNAALSRADLPEEDRSDVQVYIDEFHSFVSDGNDSFATILSESRKYRVAFAALATQFLDQIDERTISAVLGNCGSSIVFRSGVRDSETLSAHLGGIEPDDIVNLPNFTAYAKLLINGEPTRLPFSMTTQPPLKSGGRREVVREVSRRKYGRPRQSVEAKLAQSV